MGVWEGKNRSDSVPNITCMLETKNDRKKGELGITGILVK